MNNNGSNSAVGGPGDQVDLNVIPTKLIDHVDAISVGGAPIYGADAIAGAVNIILKKDYQGLDVDAQVGASGQGDAWNYRARVLGGQNMFDGRANVTVVAEMTKTDGLVGAARPVYAADLGFLAPATPGPFKTVLTPANSVPQVSFGGVPLVDDVFLSPPIFGVPNEALGVTNAGGQLLQFGPNGNLIPYNTGIQTGNPIFNSGGDGLRLSQVSNLLAPTERINIDTLTHYQLNDHINIFGEGFFSETHATNLLAQPAYNAAIFGGGGTVNGNFVVSLNNPYLSPGDRATIAAALNNYAATLPLRQPAIWVASPLARHSLSAMPRLEQPTVLCLSSQHRLAERPGDVNANGVARRYRRLNGDFAFGERNFNWEVAASYGTSSNTQVTPSYVFQNVVNALNATTNASGQIVCAGTPVNAPTSTASSTCAPLDIFGRNSPSVAALQYITHLASVESFNTQRDVTAFIAGDIIKLPAGEWKASAGYENRRESAAFMPDDFYTQDLGQAQVTGIAGSYITNEAYIETLLPIFSPSQDIPGLYRVEVEAAARRVDNSLAGDATTYTYGFRWSPIEDVQFRGNKTKSIRCALCITELFLPSATSFQFTKRPLRYKNFIEARIEPNAARGKLRCGRYPSGVRVERGQRIGHRHDLGEHES